MTILNRLFHVCTQTSYVVCSGITGR